MPDDSSWMAAAKAAPLQSMASMNQADFSALMDKTFGKGKWKLTSGYRSPGKEDALRAEGAGTVAPGKTSAHSEGTTEAPGAYDVVVDGLSPAEAAARLQKSDAKFSKLFPEGAHGPERGHLHVQPYMDPSGDWLTQAQASPLVTPKAAPKNTPKQIVDAAAASGATPERRASIAQAAPPGQFGSGVVEGNIGTGEAARDVAMPSDLGLLRAARGPIDTIAGLVKGAIDPASASAPKAGFSIPAPPNAGPSILDQLEGSLAGPPKNWLQAAERFGGQVVGSLPYGMQPKTVASAPAKAGERNMLASALRPQTAQQKAETLVARKIQQDAGRAPTAQEMLEHAERTPDKPMTLMDVGGPRVRGLAGTVARSPQGRGGKTIQDFLTDRSEMQGPRLEADIQRQIGAGSSKQTIRSLQAAQKTASGPLYDDAFEANPVIRSSVVDQIVRSKQGAPAWREAQQRAQGWVVGTDKPIPDKYSLRTLDQLKQVFDDQISMARRQGNNGSAALYKGLKDRLVKELDGLDRSGGLYAKARKTYSDSATSQEAVEFGRSALKMNPEDIADRLRGMSTGDREMARLGLAESLRDRVRATDVGRNAATKLARNRALQEQLSPFFKGPKALQKFLDSALAEDTMFRTDNEVTKGSQTAARKAEDETGHARLIGHGLQAGQHLLRGNLLGAGASAIRGGLEFATRPSPEVGEHVADILTQPVSSNTLARTLLAHSVTRRMARTGPNYLKAAAQRVAAPSAAPVLRQGQQ